MALAMVPAAAAGHHEHVTDALGCPETQTRAHDFPAVFTIKRTSTIATVVTAITDSVLPSVSLRPAGEMTSRIVRLTASATATTASVAPSNTARLSITPPCGPEELARCAGGRDRLRRNPVAHLSQHCDTRLDRRVRRDAPVPPARLRSRGFHEEEVRCRFGEVQGDAARRPDLHEGEREALRIVGQQDRVGVG